MTLKLDTDEGQTCGLWPTCGGQNSLGFLLFPYYIISGFLFLFNVLQLGEFPICIFPSLIRILAP